MVIEEFINTDPEVENLALFISSSLEGDQSIIGINIHVTDCGFQNVVTSLASLNTVTLFYTNGSELVLDVQEGTVIDDSYYYYPVTPILVDTGSLNLDSCSSIILDPPIATLRFAVTDDNALYNNSESSRTATYIYQVDRRKDAINPTNLSSIISQSASPAEVQEGNYYIKSYTGIRYDGIKVVGHISGSEAFALSPFGGSLTGGALEFDDPALAYIPFQASIHGLTIDSGSIINRAIGDRELKTLYFNPITPGSTLTTPSLNRPIYEERGNQFFRLQNIKFYIPDANILGIVDGGTPTRVPVYYANE